MNLSKFAPIALSIVVASTATVAPRRADAIVFAVSGGTGLLVSGIVLSTIGASAFTFFTAMGASWGDPAIGATMGAVFGGVPLLVGIILLDDETSPRLNFQPLNTQEQAALGVTSDEYEIYESELEQIAAATDTGAAAATRASVRSGEEAKPFFDREYATLSSETRAVMAKIVSANFQAR